MTFDRRMSNADRAGLVARSPEGHAAKSMSIKGHEEVWIKIQAATLGNWVNVNLESSGLKVINLETDLKNGVSLVALIEKLQKRKLKHNKSPINQHQEIENITIALDAIKEDGIKLVNIGNTDIHNGNLKLILGLIWSLIAHYQLGASNFPPKKLMLYWLKAVLPECKIKNFTSDWNSGINLSALLNYCKPGLIPHWKSLDPNDGYENCKYAMKLAEETFSIPCILAPEFLASKDIDELSGMTYLSYFMKEEDSPGYYATLDMIKKQLPNQRVNNFRSDWNDGILASHLVKSKGGSIPHFNDLSNDSSHWVSNLEIAIQEGRKLGVTPILEARDMTNPQVEYLGVMSWASQFQWIPDRTPPGERVELFCNTHKIQVGDECNFKINVLEDEVLSEGITGEVIGPSGPLEHLDWKMESRNIGRGVFTTNEVGMHQIFLRNEGENVRGAPHLIRSVPKSKKDYDGIDPCAVGSTVEVLINPHHAAQPELLEVKAYSPLTGRSLSCPVTEDNGTFYASFMPDEPGEWRIHVTYDREDIENSPFKCMVFDPRAIFIRNQEGARRARPGEPFTFIVDASKSPWGTLDIDVVFERSSIHKRDLKFVEISPRVYQVTFTPSSRGKHKVFVYLHGMEVKGSPFSLRIGKDVREKGKTGSEIFRGDRKVSRYKTYEEQRAEERRNIYSSEKEISIITPNAPPRSKKIKHQKLKEFRSGDESERTTLFDTEHQTDEGLDLLPIRKRIAFDCSDEGAFLKDIKVNILEPTGRKLITSLVKNDNKTFTCEFTTSIVGVHDISIFIHNNKLNATPRFYVYDSSAIKVNPVNIGMIGVPVEFSVNGNNAGYGNLEIIVNGGRVTSHVSQTSKDMFLTSFIPQETGRHRVDIKFNGETVPKSPWFVDIKDPNVPLISPGLITNTKSLSSSKDSFGVDEVDKLFLNSSSDFNSYNSNSHFKVENSTSTVNKTINSRLTPEFSSYSSLLTPTLLSKSTNKFENEDTLSRRESKQSEEKRQSDTFSKSYSTTISKTIKQPSYERPYDGMEISALVNNPKEVSLTLSKIPTSEGKERNAATLKDVVKIPSFEYNESHWTSKPSLNQSSSEVVERNETTSSSFSQSLNSLSISKKSQHPKLTSYQGTAEKCHFEGDTVRHFKAGKYATFKLNAPGYKREDVVVNIISPEKRPSIPCKVVDEGNELYRIEFLTTEIGNYVIDVNVDGLTVPKSPLIAKAYDASLIKVTDIQDGVLGELSTFRVDASKAGEGHLEISINDGDVHNAVTVLGGGKCLVTYTPNQTITNEIEVTFNGEHVPGSPFLCRVLDGIESLEKESSFSQRVSVELEHLNLIQVHSPSTFTILVAGGDDAELAVSVQGPTEDIPVKVTGNVKAGFIAEFIPEEIGVHMILVEYNGTAVGGTPFYAKSYDSESITVSDIPKSIQGKTVTFAVDASKAGEGNLEIIVRSTNFGGQSLPTKVEPLDRYPASFSVSFIPRTSTDHDITITFNDVGVPGSPFISESASALVKRY